VTQARDQNNKHDKLALATFGKTAIAWCLEKTTLKQWLFWFGVFCCWEQA